MVSVTQVEVTKDLRYAKVFVSLFAKNDEEKEESLKALKSSAGFIRREVGNRVKLRSTPEILFEEDNSIDNAMYIESLLNKIKGEIKMRFHDVISIINKAKNWYNISCISRW